MKGSGGALGFVFGLAREAAGADVEAAVAGAAAAEEGSDLGCAHGVFAVFDFDEDSGLLEAEAVGGGEDVVSAVGSGWSDAGAVAHGPQDASHQLLHLFPVEAADGVFDEGVGFAQDLFAKIVFEGPLGGFFTFGRGGGKVDQDSGHSLKIGFEVVDGVGWDFEESLNGP